MLRRSFVTEIESRFATGLKAKNPLRLKPLNRPAGHNRYCGPAVISFCTGWTTDKSAWHIRNSSGQRAVRGSKMVDVLAAMKDDGIISEFVEGFKGSTLAGALRRLRTEKRLTEGRTYLLVAGGHFQLITGRRYACGRVGEITSIADKRIKKLALVASVFELYR